MSIEEIVEEQGLVIRTESRLVDELFLFLLEHISVDDMADSCLKEIDRAANLREEVEETVER